LLRKKFSNFNFLMSYSFMDNQYTFQDLRPKNFPSNLNIAHAAKLGMAYTTTKLKISTGFNWHTGKPSTPPVFGNEIVGNTINHAPPNSARLPNYMRVDVSALYKFNIGRKLKADVGASVWNLLNRKNKINSFYRVENGAAIETRQYSLSITPNIGLRAYF